MSTESVEVDEGEKFFYFRHNNVNRFKVGKYQFQDHMATVAESDLENFLDTVEGLAPIDKNSIEQVLEIRNTRSIADLRSRIVRDVVGTKDITDPTKIQPAGAEDGQDAQQAKPATPPSLLNRLSQNANQTAT